MAQKSRLDNSVLIRLYTGRAYPTDERVSSFDNLFEFYMQQNSFSAVKAEFVVWYDEFNNRRFTYPPNAIDGLH